MKAHIERDGLEKAISILDGIVSSRDLRSQLANVLIEANGDRLFLTATDLDIAVRVHIEAQVDGELAITLPFKKLSQIIKAIRCETVEVITSEDFHAVIRDYDQREKVRYALSGFSPVEFPDMSMKVPSEVMEFPTTLLLDMIKKTRYAASDDDYRYTYSGIYIETAEGKISFTATDGKRLSRIEKSYEGEMLLGENGMIVPQKAIREIQRFVVPDRFAKMGTAGNQLYVGFENVELFANLIDGKFPNYRDALKPFVKRVVVSREDFVQSIKRVSIMSNEQSKQIRLHIVPGNMAISARLQDIGEADDTIPCQYEGEEIEYNFNYMFLLDVLSNLTCDEVSLGIPEGLSPMGIEEHDRAGENHNEFLAIIMPLNV